MFKKKNFLITVILVIILIGLLVVAYTNGRKDVPKLDVTYNGNNIEVGQGPYIWKSRGKVKEFTINSYASVISKLLPGMRVAPNGQLKLNFDYQPETITLSGVGTISSYEKVIKDNIINISEYGTGLYFLDCKWQEGTVTYIIFVNVQK
ncbi:hypothetical protein [Clostridium sp. ZS2-4]|uniref:hypothetical protein n=1 Tax=Clostridium sp. ZS2-4 TaxID=2987703 RepID=UPI00227D6490|nr:hypothetical protein [Clostridium sp. ZS2-4]MCY6356060.1 hypothetical protein [Clostridium sp. ZS2-4]